MDKFKPDEELLKMAAILSKEWKDSLLKFTQESMDKNKDFIYGSYLMTDAAINMLSTIVSGIIKCSDLDGKTSKELIGKVTEELLNKILSYKEVSEKIIDNIKTDNVTNTDTEGEDLFKEIFKNGKDN